MPIGRKKAKEKNITVSLDLNYCKNLRSPEKAQEVITKLTPYIDVCVANEEDAEKVFKIKADNTNIESGRLNKEGYKQVAEKLVSLYGFNKAAITLRESISASDNRWSGMLYDGKEFYYSKKYDMHIVDRVGGGDSFGVGLIYAQLNKYSARDSIEFAVAASCLKHTIESDFNHASVSEVETLANGDGSGRVQR